MKSKISKPVFYAIAGIIIYCIVHAFSSITAIFLIVTLEPRTDPEIVEYLIRIIGIVAGGSAAIIYTPILYNKFCVEKS